MVFASHNRTGHRNRTAHVPATLLQKLPALKFSRCFQSNCSRQIQLEQCLALQSFWLLELPIDRNQKKQHKVLETTTGNYFRRFVSELYNNQWAGPFYKFCFLMSKNSKRSFRQCSHQLIWQLIVTANKRNFILHFLRPTIRNLFATLLQHR